MAVLTISLDSDGFNTALDTVVTNAGAKADKVTQKFKDSLKDIQNLYKQFGSGSVQLVIDAIGGDKIKAIDTLFSNLTSKIEIAKTALKDFNAELSKPGTQANISNVINVGSIKQQTTDAKLLIKQYDDFIRDTTAKRNSLTGSTGIDLNTKNAYTKSINNAESAKAGLEGKDVYTKLIEEQNRYEANAKRVSDTFTNMKNKEILKADSLILKLKDIQEQENKSSPGGFLANKLSSLQVQASGVKSGMETSSDFNDLSRQKNMLEKITSQMTELGKVDTKNFINSRDYKQAMLIDLDKHESKLKKIRNSEQLGTENYKKLTLMMDQSSKLKNSIEFNPDGRSFNSQEQAYANLTQGLKTYKTENLKATKEIIASRKQLLSIIDQEISYTETLRKAATSTSVSGKYTTTEASLSALRQQVSSPVSTTTLQDLATYEKRFNSIATQTTTHSRIVQENLDRETVSRDKLIRLMDTHGVALDKLKSKSSDPDFIRKLEQQQAGLISLKNQSLTTSTSSTEAQLNSLISKTKLYRQENQKSEREVNDLRDAGNIKISTTISHLQRLREDAAKQSGNQSAYYKDLTREITNLQNIGININGNRVGSQNSSYMKTQVDSIDKVISKTKDWGDQHQSTVNSIIKKQESAQSSLSKLMTQLGMGVMAVAAFAYVQQVMTPVLGKLVALKTDIEDKIREFSTKQSRGESNLYNSKQQAGLEEIVRAVSSNSAISNADALLFLQSKIKKGMDLNDALITLTEKRMKNVIDSLSNSISAMTNMIQEVIMTVFDKYAVSAKSTIEKITEYLRTNKDAISSTIKGYVDAGIIMFSSFKPVLTILGAIGAAIVSVSGLWPSLTKAVVAFGTLWVLTSKTFTLAPIISMMTRSSVLMAQTFSTATVAAMAGTTPAFFSVGTLLGGAVSKGIMVGMTLGIGLLVAGAVDSIMDIINNRMIERSNDPATMQALLKKKEQQLKDIKDQLSQRQDESFLSRISPLRANENSWTGYSINKPINEVEFDKEKLDKSIEKLKRKINPDEFTGKISGFINADTIMVEVNGEFKKINLAFMKQERELIDGLENDPNAKKIAELFIRNFMNIGDEVNIRKIDESFGKINAVVTKNGDELQELLLKTGMKTYKPTKSTDDIKMQLIKESEEMKNVQQEIFGKMYKDLESIGIKLTPKDFNTGVMRSFIDSYVKEYSGRIQEINNLEKLYDKVPEFKLPGYVFDEKTASKELLEYKNTVKNSEKAMKELSEDSNRKQIMQIMNLTSGAAKTDIYHEEAEKSFQKMYEHSKTFKNSKEGGTDDFKAYQTKWTTDYVNFMKGLEADTISIQQEIASASARIMTTTIQQEEKKLKQYEAIMTRQYESVIKMGGTGDDVLDKIKEEVSRVTSLAQEIENKIIYDETSKATFDVSKKLKLIAEQLQQQLLSTSAPLEAQKQFTILFNQVQKKPDVPLLNSLIKMGKTLGLNTQFFENLELVALNYTTKISVAESIAAAKMEDLNRRNFDYFIQLEDKRIEAITKRYDLENTLASNAIKNTERDSQSKGKDIDITIQKLQRQMSSSLEVGNIDRAESLKSQLTQLEQVKNSLSYEPLNMIEKQKINEELIKQQKDILEGVKGKKLELEQQLGIQEKILSFQEKQIDPETGDFKININSDQINEATNKIKDLKVKLEDIEMLGQSLDPKQINLNPTSVIKDFSETLLQTGFTIDQVKGLEDKSREHEDNILTIIKEFADKRIDVKRNLVKEETKYIDQLSQYNITEFKKLSGQVEQLNNNAKNFYQPRPETEYEKSVKLTESLIKNPITKEITDAVDPTAMQKYNEQIRIFDEITKPAFLAQSEFNDALTSAQVILKDETKTYKEKAAILQEIIDKQREILATKGLEPELYKQATTHINKIIPEEQQLRLQTRKDVKMSMKDLYNEMSTSGISMDKFNDLSKLVGKSQLDFAKESITEEYRLKKKAIIDFIDLSNEFGTTEMEKEKSRILAISALKISENDKIQKLSWEVDLNSGDMTKTLRSSLNKWASDVKTVSSAAGSLLTSTMDNSMDLVGESVKLLLTKSTSEAFSEIGNNFSKLAQDMVATWTKMMFEITMKNMIKATFQIDVTDKNGNSVEAGAGMLGKILGSWFGNSSGGDLGIQAPSGGGIVNKGGTQYGWHSGGIIGRDTPSFAVMSNYPRLHSGLLPDEYRAILKKDEGVFTPGQMKALGASINPTAPTQQPQTAPTVTLNVTNNTEQQTEVSQKTNINGQDVVVELFLDAYRRDVSGLRSAMGGR